MQVYVVIEQPCHCGCGKDEVIIGVYSTPEKAQEAMDEWSHKVYNYRIEELTLDE